MEDSFGQEPQDTTKKKMKTVYAILEKPGKRSYWMKVGTAHVNSDQSWNIYLDVMPYDRKLQIRDDDRARGQQSVSSTDRMPGFEMGGAIQ